MKITTCGAIALLQRRRGAPSRIFQTGIVDQAVHGRFVAVGRAIKARVWSDDQARHTADA